MFGVFMGVWWKWIMITEGLYSNTVCACVCVKEREQRDAWFKQRREMRTSLVVYCCDSFSLSLGFG